MATKQQPQAEQGTEESTEESTEGLVKMVKLGQDEIHVHPTCVAAHEAAGWKVAE